MLCDPVRQGLSILGAVFGGFGKIKEAANRKAAVAELKKKAQEWQQKRQQITKESDVFRRQLEFWDSGLEHLFKCEDAADAIAVLFEQMPDTAQNAKIRSACQPHLLTLDGEAASLRSLLQSQGGAFPAAEAKIMEEQVKSLQQQLKLLRDSIGIELRNESFARLSLLKAPLGFLKQWAVSMFVPESKPFAANGGGNASSPIALGEMLLVPTSVS